MSTPSEWAASLLPHAPSRPVADRLIAIVEDADLPLAGKPPACGLTLPPKGAKLSATRAEFYAAAISDPADIERLQRDSRVGVRHVLAANPRVTDEWVDKTAEKAIADRNFDTFNRLAKRLPFRRLVELSLPYAADWRLVRLPAEKVAAVSPSDRAFVAATLAALDTVPAVSGNDGDPHREIVRCLASTPVAELRRLVTDNPTLVGSLLTTALAIRHVDVELASLVAEHADTVAAAIASDRHRHPDDYKAGLVPTAGVAADAAPVLVATAQPDLVAVAVNGAADALTSELVDAVFAVESPALTRALAANTKLRLTEAQAELLAVAVLERANVVSGHAGYGAQRREVYDLAALREAVLRDHPWSPSTWLEMLRAGEWVITAFWLHVRAGRHPAPGEVTALLANPGKALNGAGRDQLNGTAARAAEAGWPWADEITTVLTPATLSAGRLSSERVGVSWLASRLADVADDPEVWATAVSLLPGWPGGVDDLAQTAQAVAG